MRLDDTLLDVALKRLHLANTRQKWSQMCAKAETENWTYRDFLATAVSEEISHRHGTRLRRLAHRAGFPFLKTIDDFDFTYQSTLRITMLGSYLCPEFVSEGRNLVLHGKPGRGKTHLAVAIAYRAIQNGFEGRFVTAAALIDDLSRATHQGYFRERLQAYSDPNVLVIDELGYLSYGVDAANVLFHVVNERHQRKRPNPLTTHKALVDWGNVLHDPDLGDAVVDQISERVCIIRLGGPSGPTQAPRSWAPRSTGLTRGHSIWKPPARFHGSHIKWFIGKRRKLHAARIDFQVHHSR